MNKGMYITIMFVFFCYVMMMMMMMMMKGTKFSYILSVQSFLPLATRESLHRSCLPRSDWLETCLKIDRAAHTPNSMVHWKRIICSA
jgi:hypothetical protein